LDRFGLVRREGEKLFVLPLESAIAQLHQVWNNFLSVGRETNAALVKQGRAHGRGPLWVKLGRQAMSAPMSDLPESGHRADIGRLWEGKSGCLPPSLA